MQRASCSAAIAASSIGEGRDEGILSSSPPYLGCHFVAHGLRALGRLGCFPSTITSQSRSDARQRVAVEGLGLDFMMGVVKFITKRRASAGNGGHLVGYWSEKCSFLQSGSAISCALLTNSP